MTDAPTAVGASIEVPADPATAFAIFTEELDAWWQRGPINFYDGARAVARRMEPGVGGRHLEVYDEDAGDVLVIGRTTVWEPPDRLVYRSTAGDTETEVTFRATGGGQATLVTVEQRLLPGADPAKAVLMSGWDGILAWFRQGLDRHRRGLPPLGDFPRLSVILRYADVAKAAAFLVDAFGFEPRGALPDPGRWGGYGELSLADCVVMFETLEEGSGPAGARDHQLYVYVDDIEAHLARARAAGADIVSELTSHGDTTYVAADPEGRRWTFAQARPRQFRPRS